jgi:dipeptidyl aminopeptidase/acylaminoacyl peptidase
MKRFFSILLLSIAFSATSQNKKPLDHTVYDNWKSIGERMISNDGKFVVYAVNPQEGDGELVIQNPQTKYKKIIPRGYSAVITEDSKYAVFKIKPPFQDTRQARIKKKRPDDMPKDSLGIIELGAESVTKFARTKTFKSPEKGAGFIAYHIEKPMPDTIKKSRVAVYDSAKAKIEMLVKLADSVIKKSIDSVGGKINKQEVIEAAQKAAKQILKKADEDLAELKDADGDDAIAGAATEGTDLILRRLIDGKEKTFKLVSEYFFNKKATRLLIETTKNNKDSNSKAMVLLYDLYGEKTDTLIRGCNDCKNYAFDEEGNQLAFVAERDSSTKSLTKFYKLWHYTNGQDSAKLLAEKNTVGMKVGSTISENATLVFSKDGKKLFFGIAAIKPAKDTTLVDFELARVDVWHYNDDYLQPQQLKQLDAELKRSYTAVMNIAENKVVQLGAEDAERITLPNEGNADWVLATTNKNNRKELQWTGNTKTSAYVIRTADGAKKLVAANVQANFNASPAGKYVYWYDEAKKNYFTYDVATGVTKNVTEKIKVPIYDEDNDVPDHPNAYGVMGWSNDDKIFYVYDRYDVWNVNPGASAAPATIIDPAKMPRKNKITYRYISTDREERFVNIEKPLTFRVFDNTAKTMVLDAPALKNNFLSFSNTPEKNVFGFPVKAKNATAFIYTKENYSSSPNLYYSGTPVEDEMALSDINPQQKDFNWGTAELFKWKTYNGKQSEGIIYKPENFDPKKKYPMISYFYEKLSDGLYGYNAPSPTPSRLNISFFVSRGYVVFAPDISYTTGHPGNDAYNYIVSGVRAVVKLGYVDSTKLGLQGQSWGGYQAAYLITKTKLFAAAWAGAPVANMTSAYGGIRWGTGLNRQFQYEKTQSRIGATLWEKPNLYIENSPLFHLPKVTTPLVIMHNDADDAVPWYQGIEMFTAMRRLNKPVWLLVYNGEAHNLIERKNRKDIQIREQQFFDWKLKGEKPAKWLTDGVPATQKGIDWGLKVE